MGWVKKSLSIETKIPKRTSLKRCGIWVTAGLLLSFGVGNSNADEERCSSQVQSPVLPYKAGRNSFIKELKYSIFRPTPAQAAIERVSAHFMRLALHAKRFEKNIPTLIRDQSAEEDGGSSEESGYLLPPSLGSGSLPTLAQGYDFSVLKQSMLQALDAELEYLKKNNDPRQVVEFLQHYVAPWREVFLPVKGYPVGNVSYPFRENILKIDFIGGYHPWFGVTRGSERWALGHLLSIDSNDAGAAMGYAMIGYKNDNNNWIQDLVGRIMSAHLSHDQYVGIGLVKMKIVEKLGALSRLPPDQRGQLRTREAIEMLEASRKRIELVLDK